MSKTKRRTRNFKERQCAFCKLADKRELRQGRPNYCSYKKDNGKDPGIRNGHCDAFSPIKPKEKKEETNG